MIENPYSQSNIGLEFKTELADSHLSKQDGWNTLRVSATKDLQTVGFIDITFINESNFFKKYNILKYVNMNYSLNLDLDKDIRIQKALENNLSIEDESQFKPSTKEVVLALIEHTGKFDASKIDFYENFDMLEEIFSELINEIELMYGDEFMKFKSQTVKNAIVENIRVPEEYQGNGIGKELYCFAAYEMAKKHKVLSASYNQTDSAEMTWESLLRKDGVPTKKNKNTGLPYISYIGEVKDIHRYCILLFRKKLSSLTDDKELVKEMTQLWKSFNPDFEGCYNHFSEKNENNSILYYFKDKILAITPSKAEKIMELSNKLDSKNKEIFYKNFNMNVVGKKIKSTI